MQDDYVGDVGDFGKYALLRHLQKVSGKTLGIIWYLVNRTHTDGKHQANDGKHIGYLGLKSLNGRLLQIKPNKDSKSLRERDEDLYGKLKSIVTSGKRAVQSINNQGLLGEKAAFFAECLSTPSSVSPHDREALRKDWLERAHTATKTKNIIFLDPDNGLSSETRVGRKVDDAKYVLWTELDKFWGDGKRVIVIYHHPNRKYKGISHDRQIVDLVEEIEKRYKNAKVLPLRYRRGTSRAYIVIVPIGEVNQWRKWLQEFTEPWPVKKSKSEAIKAFEFVNVR